MFIVMTLDHTGEGRKRFGEIRVRGLFDTAGREIAVQKTDFVIVEFFPVFSVFTAYMLANVSQFCSLARTGDPDSRKNTS